MKLVPTNEAPTINTRNGMPYAVGCLRKKAAKGDLLMGFFWKTGGIDMKRGDNYVMDDESKNLKAPSNSSVDSVHSLTT